MTHGESARPSVFLGRRYFGQNRTEAFLTDWFDEVMCKSRFLRTLPVGFLSPTRYCSQSRNGGGRVIPESTSDLIPAHMRRADVQQYHVGFEGFGRRDGRLTI